MADTTTQEQKRYHKFAGDDRYRIEWLVKQEQLVTGMKKLASDEIAEGKDCCSCVSWVVELAGMIEKLHEHIYKVDPEATRS